MGWGSTLNNRRGHPLARADQHRVQLDEDLVDEARLDEGPRQGSAAAQVEVLGHAELDRPNHEDETYVGFLPPSLFMARSRSVLRKLPVRRSAEVVASVTGQRGRDLGSKFVKMGNPK